MCMLQHVPESPTLPTFLLHVLPESLYQWPLPLLLTSWVLRTLLRVPVFGLQADLSLDNEMFSFGQVDGELEC